MNISDQQLRPTPFSPLARAIMDAFGEGVIVFDAEGKLAYANGRARAVLNGLNGAGNLDAHGLLPVLARLGGRITPLRIGAMTVGEAVYLPGETETASLADREREAILSTLEQTHWRLAESARRLGISRTTLWRRLKAYGLHRDKRGRWSTEESPAPAERRIPLA